MKKRLLSVLLATTMVMGMPMVCKAEDKVKLTFYCNAVLSNDTPDIIEAFNEEYPNIEVEYVELPSDATKKNQTLSTILQAQDDSMDVFMIDTTWPMSYTSSGWLESLDDVVTDEEKDGYVEGAISACTVNDQLMALPVFVDAGVLLYRQDLLEKYDLEVPTTWDELIEDAKTISAGEDGVSGFVSSWKQYENLTCGALEFIKDYGGDIVDNDGNTKIGSEESGKGIQKMREMIEEGVTESGITGYTVPDAAAIFNSGNAAFFRAWPSNYVEANNEEVSSVVGNVGVTTLPEGTDGSYSCLGGWHVAVSSFSSHKEEAKLFAKFFSSEKANKIRALAGGNLPAVKSVYDDEEVKEARPYFEYLKPCAENAVPRPKTAYYEEVSSAVQQGISEVLAGTTSVEDAQSVMQSTIEEIMSR